MAPKPSKPPQSGNRIRTSHIRPSTVGAELSSKLRNRLQMALGFLAQVTDGSGEPRSGFLAYVDVEHAHVEVHNLTRFVADLRARGAKRIADEVEAFVVPPLAFLTVLETKDGTGITAFGPQAVS